MSFDLNVKSCNNVPHLNTLQKRQNVSFGAQSGAQDTVQLSGDEQNSPAKSGTLGKLLFGAALVGLGGLATFIVFKMRGKTPSAEAATKAVIEAAAAATDAAGKTEGAADASKPSFMQKIKDKVKSFFADVKKGYNEYTPQPAPKPSGAGKPLDVMREAIAAKLAATADITSSFEKVSANAKRLTDAAIQPDGAAAKAFENAALEEWATRMVHDASSATSSFVNKGRFGKIKSALRMVDAENWQYYEDFSRSLTKKTSKAKRRISVTPDEIKVCINDVKNNKKNIETAETLFKFDRNTGMVEYYGGYKVSPEGTEYSRMIVKQQSGPILRITDGCHKLPDGTVTYDKGMNFDLSSRPVFYIEGFAEKPDGSLEVARQFNLMAGDYVEGVKIASDGSMFFEKRIEFDNADKPVAYFENYALAGGGSAKVKIEYEPGTGQPKYYYEDYARTTAGDETYSLKAEFVDGEWVKVD